MAVTLDGEVYTWGNGANGSLGLADWSVYSKPKLVVALREIVAVMAVASGHHSVVLDEEGGFWAWGDNTCGELGCGDCFKRYVSTFFMDPLVNYPEFFFVFC